MADAEEGFEGFLCAFVSMGDVVVCGGGGLP